MRGRGKQLPHFEGSQEAELSELHMERVFGQGGWCCKEGPDVGGEGADHEDDDGGDGADEDDRRVHAEIGCRVLK